jgi:hypothetical protein
MQSFVATPAAMELYANAGRLVTPSSTAMRDIEFENDGGALERFEEARKWRARAAYVNGPGKMAAMGLVVTDNDNDSPDADKEEACVYIDANARRTDAAYVDVGKYIEKRKAAKGGK